MTGEETVDKVADHWYKIMALSMRKLGINHVCLTASDMGQQGFIALCVKEDATGLHISLIEDEKLAQELMQHANQTQ